MSGLVSARRRCGHAASVGNTLRRFGAKAAYLHSREIGSVQAPVCGIERCMPAKRLFEELDYRETPLGELILRRRTVMQLDNLDVYEVILGDGFLMSSLFTEVEVALARLGLAAVEEGFPAEEGYEVVVGGLGLGYTARAALENSKVGSLYVVDYLAPVIEWHEKGLVPLGPELTADPRCRFVLGDFFKLALAGEGESGFDPANAGRRFHAVLLDIDHSPSHLLHERHGAFYDAAGLRTLASKLHPGRDLCPVVG